jgi:hypothetical protein
MFPPVAGRPPAEQRGFVAAPAAQAAPQSPETTSAALRREPELAGKRKSRNRADRDSRTRAKKERTERSRSNAENDAAAESTGDAAECGPGLIPVGTTGRCTHGPDPEPPGIARDLAVGQPTARAVRQETAGIACEGDGQSGYRVQVIYAYDTSKSSNYNQVVGNIRIAAAGADNLMRQSSSAAGQEMHFLFVHDAQCTIDVKPVGFSTAAMQNFGSMITAMDRTSGQNRKDRIYLIFADTTSAGYCGIGTMVHDDSDSPANENNSGPGYSRVDRNCWAPQTAVHEMMHNLGGVQNSAPYSSGGGHCIDEWDVMCYSDTPNRPTMQYRCPDRAAFQNQIDCNYDNYFNPNPAPGSYLDTHWNTADSVFLQSGPGNCPAAAQGCLGALALSTSQSSVKSSKRVKLSASISNTTSRNSTITLRSCRGSSCTWDAGQTVATLSGTAPSTEWKATGKGRVTFVAQITTGSGVVTSNPVTVKVKKPRKKH